jgi:uncharacterized protein YbjT (DUF2867 family)
MKNTITILGAKGKVGIEVLKYFAKNNISCNAITRDIKNIVQLPGITWLRGDLSDYQGIPELIAGTERLFLNTDFSPKMAEIKINLIKEAQKASVKHIVYLSYGLMPAEMLQQANSVVHGQHIQAEQALIASGIAYTIIRPSGFMQSWLYERAPLIREEKKIIDATGEGKIPYIDTRDIAEVITKALYLEPEKHRGKIYELTGDEAVNFYQVAAAISLAIGSMVTFVDETPEEARLRIIKKGYPEWAIDLVLYFAECQRKGMVEETTPILSELLGRPAGDIVTFARDYAEYFV